MNDKYEYVKTDIAVEVEYPGSPNSGAPEAPNSAYVAYVIDTPGAKPGEDGLYDGYEVCSVPANSREIVEWQSAYGRFQERVQVAHLTLQVAEQQWRQAKEQWLKDIQAAVGEYSPVHEEIQGRKAMMEAQDELEYERERLGKTVIEAAAMEAEDAVYGPRHWVVRYKGSALSRTPGSRTLHTVDCRHVQDLDRNSLSKPMRQADAQKFLTDTVFVKRCGTCQPEKHFKDLPDVPTIPQQRSS